MTRDWTPEDQLQYERGNRVANAGMDKSLDRRPDIAAGVGQAPGRGFSSNGSGGMGPEQLALLLKNGGGDPSVSAYIHDMLAQWASPFNYNASLKASRFNPPAAMPGNPVGGTAHGQRTLGFTNGTNIDLGARKQRYEQGYQDKRSAANRQTQLDQDYNQENRLAASRLQLLQRLMGQSGGGMRETQEQVFNNAGGPEIVQLHRTQSTDPMQLLQYLFR